MRYVAPTSVEEAVQLLDSLGLVVSDVQEVFRFGLIMTAIAIAVVFLILPYWNLLGEGLVP